MRDNDKDVLWMKQVAELQHLMDCHGVFSGPAGKSLYVNSFKSWPPASASKVNSGTRLGHGRYLPPVTLHLQMNFGWSPSDTIWLKGPKCCSLFDLQCMLLQVNGTGDTTNRSHREPYSFNVLGNSMQWSGGQVPFLNARLRAVTE